LNVFFGVPNVSEEILPQHLQYLKTYFRKEPMNFLFPVSVTVSTGCAIWIARLAGAADTRFEIAGFALLTTLMALAILEHWFLVLPLSSLRLWSWSARSHAGTIESLRG
ncbi:MAG: DUF3623 family protein, partial [Pyrinomonadaceae bacterium]